VALAPLLTALAALALGASPAPAAERSAIPERYRWKLQDLYPSDAAWEEARAAFPARVAAFARHEGHLGDSAKALADALTELAALEIELTRIEVYASSRRDEDLRQPGPRAMRGEAEQLAVQASAASAFLRPELLALPADRLRAFVPQDPRLADWSFWLENQLRWKPHTLSSAEERIVARTGDFASTGRDVQAVLVTADLPYPTVKLSTGEEVRLDQSAFERTRTSPDPADRRKVFEGFFGALAGYQRTLGAALAGQVQAHLFDARVHRFDSALEAALFRDDVPTAVYAQLVKDVNANLPTLHRYLALRKRMLGLDVLGYEDLYTPLVKGNDRRFGIDEAMATVLAAVAPLGTAYQEQLAKGYQSGWTDFLPSTGKRGGAYSTGVYGLHPFQLLNFDGQWLGVSTLAHESGHSMHTVLASGHQPYPTAEYAIFVAEVASTLNENLLFRHALAEAKDDPTRLALLGDRLESLRTTLFRQTMFAEFELAIHQRAEKGEALTGEAMSALYLGLLRRYHGHDQGICRVSERYAVEWSFVPHFYRDFYVYQYATSIVASTALARAILDDEARGSTAARDRYLALLSAGGSDHPVKLLQRAGVDLTTSAPFTAAIQEMNGIMDRIEAILAKGQAAGTAPVR